MRELTPELYTELNKTIDRLRKEKKDLAFENIDLKAIANNAEKEQKLAIEKVEEIKKQIEQLKASIFSPKLNEIRLFIKEYLNDITQTALIYESNTSRSILNEKVYGESLSALSYITYAYLLGDKGELKAPSKELKDLSDFIMNTNKEYK